MLSNRAVPDLFSWTRLEKSGTSTTLKTSFPVVGHGRKYTLILFQRLVWLTEWQQQANLGLGRPVSMELCKIDVSKPCRK